MTKVSELAKDILLTLGHDAREAELAQIAGYMHDIGNVVNRSDHAQSGAVMAFRILDNLGADAADIATIITAIGNHDEGTAFPVNAVTAAIILADKTDVRRSRVRKRDFSTFDIHDRVNYAAHTSRTYITEDKRQIVLEIDLDTELSSVMDYFEIFMQRMLLCTRAAENHTSRTYITEDKRQIVLEIDLDTELSSVMDYFEIFMQRMLLCTRAAEKLGLRFSLVINGQKVL